MRARLAGIHTIRSGWAEARLPGRSNNLGTSRHAPQGGGAISLENYGVVGRVAIHRQRIGRGRVISETRARLGPPKKESCKRAAATARAVELWRAGCRLKIIEGIHGR